MPQEPWHPEKGTKPDRVIQFSCGEVRSHASYKTTGTWENFNNTGTKITLLSCDLWLIANNSNSFAIRSTSIIRSNLGLCKYSEIYVIYNFDLMVQKHRFGKERCIKQINDIREWQKITAEFHWKRSCLKRIRVRTQGRKEVEVGTLLLGSNKNKVIANQV